jgi:hypothetical protein
MLLSMLKSFQANKAMMMFPKTAINKDRGRFWYVLSGYVCANFLYSFESGPARTHMSPPLLNNNEPTCIFGSGAVLI